MTAACARFSDTDPRIATSRCSRHKCVRFAGVAGVYDLAKHYDFESNRQVQELSTMEVRPPSRAPGRAPGSLPRQRTTPACVMCAEGSWRR